METKTTRPRTKNFSSREVELLLELADSVKDIVENKKSDASVWESKHWAWQDIAREFNKRGLGIPRSVEQIKGKYETIKKEKRKANRAGEEWTFKRERFTYEPLASNAEESDTEFSGQHKKHNTRDSGRMKPEKRSRTSANLSDDSDDLQEAPQKLEHVQLQHEARMNVYRLEEQELQMKIEILKIELEIKRETLRRLCDSK